MTRYIHFRYHITVGLKLITETDRQVCRMCGNEVNVHRIHKDKFFFCSCGYQWGSYYGTGKDKILPIQITLNSVVILKKRFKLNV